MKISAIPRVILVIAATLQFGCASEGSTDDNGAVSAGLRRYDIQFAPTVNGDAFSCGKEYQGIGMGGTTLQARDFRLWLHDIRLVRRSGEESPLTLDESRPTNTVKDDGAWQKSGVALLDFEDATGLCGGTPETRLNITGTAPQRDDYVGIRFKVGVPAELNHLNATVAEYPFGAPGMAWQWKSGYRFVRIDAQTENFPQVYFHLGSTSCAGTIGEYDCEVQNVAEIELSQFVPSSSHIEVDLAAIYDEVDIDEAGKQTTACMSGGTTNPLCPSMFGALGLSYGDAAGKPQRFFKVN